MIVQILVVSIERTINTFGVKPTLRFLCYPSGCGLVGPFTYVNITSCSLFARRLLHQPHRKTEPKH